MQCRHVHTCMCIFGNGYLARLGVAVVGCGNVQHVVARDVDACAPDREPEGATVLRHTPVRRSYAIMQPFIEYHPGMICHSLPRPEMVVLLCSLGIFAPKKNYCLWVFLGDILGLGLFRVAIATRVFTNHLAVLGRCLQNYYTSG